MGQVSSTRRRKKLESIHLTFFFQIQFELVKLQHPSRFERALELGSQNNAKKFRDYFFFWLSGYVPELACVGACTSISPGF